MEQMVGGDVTIENGQEVLCRNTVTGLVEQDIDELVRLVPEDEREENDDFGDGVKGTSELSALIAKLRSASIAHPVWPARPRAAPVAVKKTITSRNREMLWIFCQPRVRVLTMSTHESLLLLAGKRLVLEGVERDGLVLLEVDGELFKVVVLHFLLASVKPPSSQ